MEENTLNRRFFYEPLLAAHPKEGIWPSFSFLGKKMQVPIWVSSMTGGTAKAQHINRNLARVCKEFGFGMGLGSCRPLLENNDRFADFDIRDIIGEEQLLFANLGVAQLEKLFAQNNLDPLTKMIEQLRVDGLIIHVNPLQEWLQPEGDRFQHSPLYTIKQILNTLPTLPIIIKEVGQGMGRESLKALLQLPLAAIDFAAYGGTNFAKLELLRSTQERQKDYTLLANIGHTASDMTEMTKQLIDELGDKVRCKQFIISGGIQNFLDGYYYIEKLGHNSIYGQASAFLSYAQGDYENLRAFAAAQVRGLELAKAYLSVRE